MSMVSSSASSTTTTTEDLPPEILNCIQRRLPVDDYLRFPAACSSWRSAAKRIGRQPFSDTEFPWLFSLDSGKGFASAISLSPDNSLPPKIYSIPVPERFRDYTILSADAHRLIIEDTAYPYRPPSGIYIVNPFDSWTQLGLLPSSTTLSANPADHKLCGRILRVAMNGSVAVAMWSYLGPYLAYTRLGVDRVWIDLKDYDILTARDHFQDVVAYKDGLFCALDSYARKVIALDFSSPSVKLMDMTLNLPAYRGSNGWSCFQHARLVNSSSKLFLVRWRNLIKKGEAKRREVDVYKLIDDDDAEKKWVPVESLGNLSFFLGSNQSISLSATNFPKLKSNCIYIPHDAFNRINPHDYLHPATLEDDDDFCSQLIYDLGDESWEEYYSDEHFNGVWMTPRLLSKSISLLNIYDL